MKISENGLNLIKSFESLRLTAYKALQTEKYWTIGWGHNGADVHEGDTVTREQADALLLQDIQDAENAVNKYVSTYNFTQNQYDALVSFAFNVGNINKLTQNGTRDISTIADKMLEYNKSGGVYVEGLYNRRVRERELFLDESDYTATISAEDFTPSSVRISSQYTARNKREIVYVYTSTDVYRVVIDGNNMTRGYSGSQYRYYRSIYNVSVGTKHEIILYDRNGKQSAKYIVTVLGETNTGEKEEQKPTLPEYEHIDAGHNVRVDSNKRKKMPVWMMIYGVR